MAVGEFELRVGRQMAVNNVRNLHAFEQRADQGQRTEIEYFLGACGSMPGEAHDGFSFSLSFQGLPREQQRAEVCRRGAAPMIRQQSRPRSTQKTLACGPSPIMR